MSKEQTDAFYKYCFVLLSGSNRHREAGYTTVNFLRVYNRDSNGYLWDSNQATWPYGTQNRPTRHTDLVPPVGIDLLRRLSDDGRRLLASDSSLLEFRYTDSIVAARDQLRLPRNTTLTPLEIFSRLHASNAEHCHFLTSNGNNFHV